QRWGVRSSGGRPAEPLCDRALEAQGAGHRRPAFARYHQPILQSKDGIPACHNNLGVIMVKAGSLEEAAREFEAAVKLSHSKFAEASQNLARLRQMLDGPSPAMIAGLKTFEGSPGSGMKAE